MSSRLVKSGWQLLSRLVKSGWQLLSRLLLSGWHGLSRTLNSASQPPSLTVQSGPQVVAAPFTTDGEMLATNALGARERVTPGRCCSVDARSNV